MGLLNWLAGLFGGKPDEAPADVADRIDRIADRFANSGDEAAASAARTAADAARKAPTLEAARRIEINFLESRGLGPDGRPLKPVVGLGPTNTPYVRYGGTLRTGGSRAWRYNNPGYVRCSSRSTDYGALGCDGEYAIFPDYTTGVNAMRMSLRDDYPNHTVRDALRQHLPAEAGADPDRLCDEASLDPGARVEDLSDDDCESIAPALGNQAGWEEGEQFDRGAMDAPDWVETAWETTGVAEAAAAEALAVDDAAPTDNS